MRPIKTTKENIYLQDKMNYPYSHNASRQSIGALYLSRSSPQIYGFTWRLIVPSSAGSETAISPPPIYSVAANSGRLCSNPYGISCSPNGDRGMLYCSSHGGNRFRSSPVSRQRQFLAERRAHTGAGAVVDQPGCRRKSGCRLVFRTGLRCLLLPVVQVTLYSASAGRKRNPCVAGANIHTLVHHCLRVLG